jgi:hypothetical protein
MMADRQNSPACAGLPRSGRRAFASIGQSALRQRKGPLHSRRDISTAAQRESRDAAMARNRPPGNPADATHSAAVSTVKERPVLRLPMFRRQTERE